MAQVMPSDANVVGNPNHTPDHNNITDMLRLLTATLAEQYTVKLTGTTPASDAANITALQAAASAMSLRQWEFCPEAYGALGNGVVIGDGIINSGSNSFTSAASYTFTAADVGKYIMVNGALGSNAAPLITTIASVSAGAAILAASATANVTGGSTVFGSDDTAAINSAVQAAAAYAESAAVLTPYRAQVIFGNKVYCLASGPTQTGNGTTTPTFNSQVPIPYPNVNGSTQKLIVEFIGTGDAASPSYFDSTVPNRQGTSLVSMVLAPGTPSATYGAQSVIGGPTGTAGFTGQPLPWYFANVHVRMQGIRVVTPILSNQIGYDFRYCATMSLSKSSAMAFSTQLEGNSPTFGSIQGLTPFTTTISVGLYTPLVDNNAESMIEDVFTVEGFNTGIGACEHLCAPALQTFYNNTHIYVNMQNGNQHGIYIGKWIVQTGTYGLYSGGGGYTANIFAIKIGLMDAETGMSAYDIYDPSNNFNGEVWMNKEGYAFLIDGGTNLRVLSTNSTRGFQSFPSYSNGVAFQNPFYRDSLVTISGGTVTNISLGPASGSLTTVGTTGVTNLFVPTGWWLSITESVTPAATWYTT